MPDDDGDILRAKVIDSWFESKRGVIALVRILSGKVEENDRISIIEPASYEQIAAGNADAHIAQKDNYSVQEGELVNRSLNALNGFASGSSLSHACT